MIFLYLKIEKLKESLEVEINGNKYYYDIIDLETFKSNLNIGNYFINNNEAYLCIKAKKIENEQKEGDILLALAIEGENIQKEIIDMELVKNERLKELELKPNNNSIVKDNDAKEYIKNIFDKVKKNDNNKIEINILNEDFSYTCSSFILWIIYLLELKKEDDFILEYLANLCDEIIQRDIEIKEIAIEEQEKENQEESEHSR